MGVANTLFKIFDERNFIRFVWHLHGEATAFVLKIRIAYFSFEELELKEEELQL